MSDTNTTTAGPPDDGVHTDAPATDPYAGGVPEEPEWMRQENEQLARHLGYVDGTAAETEQPAVGRPNGNAPSVDRQALLDAANHLIELGWHIEPVGAGKKTAMPKGYTTKPAKETSREALRKIADPDCRVDGFAVVLGERSRRPGTDGEPDGYLYAIEWEGPAVANPGFMAEFKEIVSAHDADDLFARLEAGWSETTSRGGLRHFFSVSTSHLESLDARAVAVRRKIMHVEILTQRAIAAPSGGCCAVGKQGWERRHGGPDTVPTLTPDELAVVAGVVRAADDGGAANQGSADGRTARQSRIPYIADVARAYNRDATTEETLMLLIDAGWRERGDHAEGEEVDLTRPGTRSGDHHAYLGGPNRAAGRMYVFTTSDDRLPEGLWPPFDVYARLCHNGDELAAAKALVSCGRVDRAVERLVAPDRPRVVVTADPAASSAALARNAAAAKHPTIPDAPFLLQHVVDDQVIAPLSVTVDGGIRRWTHAASGVLAHSTSQCGSRKDDPKSGKGATKWCPATRLPPDLTAMAFDELFTGRTRLPVIRQIADRPVLLADGRSVATPGLHLDSEVVITITDAQAGVWSRYQVPDEITQQDAQEAFDWICAQVLDGFPFQTVGDRCRAVAYLITCVTRDLYPTSPGFMVPAHDRGTGKGLLVRTGMVIGTGHPTAVSVGFRRREDAEIEKQLVAAALAGRRHIHVDELPRGEAVTSTKLSELLTAPVVELRKLGVNETVAVSGTILTICGNNVTAGGDFSRRLFPIRLAWTGVGAPSDRDDFEKPDLLGWVHENRPEILARLHTIAAYGLRAGEPAHPLPAFGSYEGWTAVVLGALSRVACSGETAAQWCADGLAEWREQNDPLAEEWGPFLADVYNRVEAFRRSPPVTLTTGDLRNRCTQLDTLPVDLLPVGDASETGEVRRWARALKHMANTRVAHNGDGYRLKHRGSGEASKRSAAWFVERESAASPPSTVT